MDKIKNAGRRLVEPEKIPESGKEKLQSLFVYICAFMVIGVLSEIPQFSSSETGPAVLTIILLGASQAIDFSMTVALAQNGLGEFDRIRNYFPASAAAAFAVSINYYPKVLQATIATGLFTLGLFTFYVIEGGEGEDGLFSRIGSWFFQIMLLVFLTVSIVMIVFGLLWLIERFSPALAQVQ
jgi:hypothetical protein